MIVGQEDYYDEWEIWLYVINLNEPKNIGLA